MLILLLSFLLAQAPVPITPDAPVTVALVAYAGPLDLAYTAAGPERIAITARSQADTPVDVTLAVLDGARLLAFDDDGGAAQPGLLPTDAYIARLDLPGAGVYTLRLNSFSGAQDGPVAVTLTRLPLLSACPPEQTVTLVRGDVFRCTLDLPAGARLTATARSVSGALDPLLALAGPDGAQTALNDDHDAADAALGPLDAHLAAVDILAAGQYTLALTEFTGADGPLALTVTVSP